MAGPIITFNNFTSQLSRPIKQHAIPVLHYGLRWVGALLLIEVLLHLFPVVAIKNAHAWLNFSALDFIMLAYLNLNIVWLKLLLIWRFFRLIALSDGIVTTENMERCITNTHSMLAFWRSWHRSFNLWIIRYMYIPLGGRKSAAWNVWPIFTFVAIWHDVRANLLIWSWLVCIIILPEVILLYLSHRFHWESSPWYSTLAAMAAGGNMVLMGTANLVGFVVGIDGTKTMCASWISSSGITTFIALLGVCYCISQVQFEIRNTEKSMGIIKNY
jgi:D-alanyl-lipoteichoic acid acyltransferase DltB (MBOAT superfamily)